MKPGHAEMGYARELLQLLHSGAEHTRVSVFQAADQERITRGPARM